MERRLREAQGAIEEPPTRDPFELVLFENVAYLAKPEKRKEAFLTLKEEVGLQPGAILAAKRAALERVTARGILKSTFADKLRECARILRDDFGGDLNAALVGDIQKAKRALRKFPGIGVPGAEKILSLSGRAALLAPDSNALRVLLRLGWIRDEANYARTYEGVRPLDLELRNDVARARTLYLLLVRHGRTICRSTTPKCGECALKDDCPSASLRS